VSYQERRLVPSDKRLGGPRCDLNNVEKKEMPASVPPRKLATLPQLFSPQQQTKPKRIISNVVSNSHQFYTIHSHTQ